MHISRNWLQKYFSDPLPPADELVRLFTFHSFEVEGCERVGDDDVLDIDILANRSSDCLSHRGIARELSVLLDMPLAEDPLASPLPAWEKTDLVRVDVEDSTLCPRYMGALVRGVTVGPSPAWLVEALAAVGQKSINNVVDATNYVMWNIGQPLHAFDFDKLGASPDGARHIAVRAAYEGESFVSLTGEAYTLTPLHLVIADKVRDVSLALAGIKGGKDAEVTTDTTDIVLEAANFHYVSVRKTSRALRLATDSSLRFQNEPSPLLPAFALRDVAELIRDIAGGALVGVTDVFTEPPARAPVRASRTDINALLGTNLSNEDIERILVRFEFDFSRDEHDVFTVTPPWERTDLNIPADLIEEVGRIHGYNNLAGVLPPRMARPPVSKTQYYGDLVRTTLAARGYSEVYTYTLRSQGEVALVNPLAADKAYMRMNLRDGVAEALAKNMYTAPVLGLEAVKIFELGPVFRAANEDLAVCMGVRGARPKEDAQTLREDIAALAAALGMAELPGAEALGVFETDIGAVFELLPEPVLPPVELPWNPKARYKAWSNYPFVLRDVAVWVPLAVPADEVRARIVTEATDLLMRADLFDEFTKNGRTSYAFHLVFQAPDRTLSDAEIGGEIDRIAEAFRRELWEMR